MVICDRCGRTIERGTWERHAVRCVYDLPDNAPYSEVQAAREARKQKEHPVYGSYDFELESDYDKGIDR